jgi:hypothetical protein
LIVRGQGRATTTYFLWLLLAAGVSAACCQSVRAETIDVQSVLATDAGKSGSVPPSLKKFTALLAHCSFQKFTDSGTQALDFAAAPKASVTVGAFTLDFTRQGAAKFDVTVKEGPKTVLGPLAYVFAKEKTKQLELPTPKGTFIVFFTLEKE